VSSSLRGSVIAVMPVDPDAVPPRYAWDFPHPLAVLAVDIRQHDHVQLLQLLDQDLEVVATLLLPRPDVEDPA